MTILTIIFGLFGVVGGSFGVLSYIITRRQLSLLRQDISERKKHEAEGARWAERFEELSTRLLRINPHLEVQEPGVTGTTCVYLTMFPDPKFRLDIESLIVEVDPSGALFMPRTPEPYEFRSKRMRETIERAESLMAKFALVHPSCALHLLDESVDE
jgi:hypothetical protein